MTTAADKSNVNPNSCAWLALNERSRRRTSRWAWPSDPRLKPWSARSRSTMEVEFVGSPTLKGHVRTILIVPGDEPIEFTLKQTRPEWHYGQHSRAALFQRQDKALANGNTSGLPDRPS